MLNCFKDYHVTNEKAKVVFETCVKQNAVWFAAYMAEKEETTCHVWRGYTPICGFFAGEVA